MGKRQRRKVIEGIVTCEKTCIDIGGWVWILLLLRRSKVCLAKTQTDQLTGEKDDKSSHCCNYDPTSKAGLLGKPHPKKNHVYLSIAQIAI